MKQELFDLGNGYAVNFNPGGRFHGWLFQRHPVDGNHWVSIKMLENITEEVTSAARLAGIDAAREPERIG
jgi:hypothetical protein